MKVVWDASTRWNVDGKFIDREIFWGVDEADTKVGWQIIEDLLWQAEPSAGLIMEGGDQEYVGFDKNCVTGFPDVTLARKEDKETDKNNRKEVEEEESGEEELERSLDAEAYEEEQAVSEHSCSLEKPATKVNVAKDNTGYKHRRQWKFCRSSRRKKLWKKIWQPCHNKDKLRLTKL